jgi:hypothetical protein
MALLVSSCSGGGSSSATPIGQIDLSTTFNVDVNNLPVDGVLHVYVSVDSGAQQDMQVVNTTASASISSLSIGAHSVDIEVVFVYNNGTSVTLSSTSSSIDVVEGSNPLDISSTTYVTTYDDDDDGVTNLDEMNAGTSPSDPTCVLGVSVLGSCTLG